MEPRITQRRPGNEVVPAAPSHNEMGAGDKPLHERDPEAWNALLAEGNASQPRKRVATDARYLHRGTAVI
jgi:hypothetical protein